MHGIGRGIAQLAPVAQGAQFRRKRQVEDVEIDEMPVGAVVFSYDQLAEAGQLGAGSSAVLYST